MRTKTAIIILCFTFLSCKQKQKSDEHFEKRIESSELQTILDSLNVNGAILIFDFNKNSYYANNFQLAEKNSIPASTFKIPNSVIGLETGILQDEKTVFKWNGEKRAFPNWEKDLTLKEAFQSSCVPCYQELAKKIGIERMNDYLAKLNFGEMVVTDETLANFWLIGSSKISPFQQIDFLKRLYTKELPISESTNKTVIEILKIEENINFTLSGKTGLAVHLTNDIGWFVGYLEKNKEVFYFATNISPNDSNMDRNEFLSIRKTATLLALKELKFID